MRVTVEDDSQDIGTMVRLLVSSYHSIHTLSTDVEETHFVGGEGVRGCFAEVGD